MLREQGITTWFDEEQMRGNVITKMSEGIDSSQCVVVFIINKKYFFFNYLNQIT